MAVRSTCTLWVTRNQRQREDVRHRALKAGMSSGTTCSTKARTFVCLHIIRVGCSGRWVMDSACPIKAVQGVFPPDQRVQAGLHKAQLASVLNHITHRKRNGDICWAVFFLNRG